MHFLEVKPCVYNSVTSAPQKGGPFAASIHKSYEFDGRSRLKQVAGTQQEIESFAGQLPAASPRQSLLKHSLGAVLEL